MFGVVRVTPVESDYFPGKEDIRTVMFTYRTIRSYKQSQLFSFPAAESA